MHISADKTASLVQSFIAKGVSAGSRVYTALLESIRAHAPAERREADLPLTISQRRAEALLHVVHDIGGQPDGPIDKTSHKIAPWEQRTHAPRQVLAEFGLIIPPDVEIRVHDSNQKTRYMVLPMRPSGTEGWSEEKLASIVTRDTMIGVAVPSIDWTASSAPDGSGRAA